MKNIISVKALLIILTMFYTTQLMAQHKKDVPAAVTAAFAAKYPKAEADNWKMTGGLYVAKATVTGYKVFTAFDANGNWLNTTSKINWPWHLPAAVKKAFNQSLYKNWNMYTVKLVEKPSGKYYQIIVDNRNHPADIYHQDLVIERRSIEITATGELVKDADESVSL